MKLRIKSTYINILIFTSFLFLWSLNIAPILKYDFLKIPAFIDLNIPFYPLKNLILLLIFPILLKLFKDRKFFSISEIFKNQKYILLLFLFVILHFFLTKFINHQTIESRELYKIIYLGLISIIFIHYRSFLKDYFEHILLFYLILRIFSSYYFSENPDFFIGECNSGSASFYYYLQNSFNISITNILFKENSHLSMMMIAVTLCNIFIITNSKKINFFYILLFILSTLVIFFNYSTTFFICYTISFIVIAIFFNKKFSIKFLIFSFIFLILNSIIFFGDSNCSKKITDINVKNIVEKKIGKGDESMGKKFGSFPGKRNNSSEYKNLTTLIYERSAILTLDTFQYYPLGWGFDGMDNATKNLINKDRYSSKEIFIGDGLTRIFNLKNEVYGIGSDNFIVSLDAVDKSQLILDSSKDYSLGVQQKRGPEKDYILSLDESNKLKRITFKTPPKKGDIIYVIKDIYIFAKILNLNDGLSNFFKILNEFGIFSLFILYFFIKYLLKIKKITTYNLFIIVIFVTMSIRGAGYFNGGFIFCLLEFFYMKKLSNKEVVVLSK